MKRKSNLALMAVAVIAGLTLFAVFWQTFNVVAAQNKLPAGEPVMLDWASDHQLTFTLLMGQGFGPTYRVDEQGRLLDVKSRQARQNRAPQRPPNDGGHNSFPGPDGQQLRWQIDHQRSKLVYENPASHEATIVWQGSPLTVLEPPQWQPGGKAIVFATAPYGSATLPESQSWIAWPGQVARPLPLPAGAHGLRWRPDGGAIAFVQSGNIGLYDLATRKYRILWRGGGGRPAVKVTAATQSAGPLTPPLFIRVLHRAENHCRAYAQPGEIDLIDFETYVAHVLPAEIYASWPTATLRAQAIAARTFAWYHILHSQNDRWDVTDWADYQMFCDDHQAPTNKAALDTAGEYMAYGNNLPILAQYSAQNGHPTLPLGSVPYLQSVPDPVDMGETRYGHGHGMSQIGAARWAYRHDWNVYQILHHYYAGITIWRPPAAGNGPDETAPRASLQILDPDRYLFGNTLPVAIDANDDISGVQAITLTAITGRLAAPMVIFSGTAATQPWRFDWPIPVPLSETRQIRIGGRVTDRAGNTAPVRPYTFTWEHQPPAVQVQAVSQTVTNSVTVTLSSPADRLTTAQIGFSRWAWQGEALFHQPDSGTIVADPQAENGRAWFFRAGRDTPGWLYGPYTDQIPAGAAYRAWFRLRGNPLPNAADRIVARLDVTADQGRDLLGIRNLHGYDLLPGRYQEIPVDFYCFADTVSDLEFRVHFTGQADLWVDRIAVATYPQPAAARMLYALPPTPGVYTVTPFINSGGGLGYAAPPLHIQEYAPDHALAWESFAPQGWISRSNPVTVSLSVYGRGSRLVAGSFRYRQKSNDVWQGWEKPLAPAIIPGNGLRWQQPLILPGGRSAVQWRGADAAGYTNLSPVFPLNVDRQPPTLTWQLPPANSFGWYTAPLTLTILATDTASGVSAVRLWQDGRPAGIYNAPIRLSADSNSTWTARAEDEAGNWSRPASRIIRLDVAPPEAPALSLRLAADNHTIMLHWQAKSTTVTGTFSVEMNVDDTPAWTRLLTHTIHTSLAVHGYAFRHYRFRVRQQAASGWESAWAGVEITISGKREFLPWVEAP